MTDRWSDPIREKQHGFYWLGIFEIDFNWFWNWHKFTSVTIGQNYHKWSKLSQLVITVTIGDNCHNCHNLSQLSILVTIGHNCHIYTWNVFCHICSYLCQAVISSNLSQLVALENSQVKTGFNMFDHFWTIWNKYGQVWSSLDMFEQVWSSLIKFNQVWTS